jgi:hypothetical protein
MTTLELLSGERKSLLLAFSRTKKLAFLILLFDRMLPELCSYFLASRRDFSVIQKARERFWRCLSGDETSASWGELRETILDTLPDMDDDGSLPAQLALYAGLVAADIAGLAEDGQDSHVTEPLAYALGSIDAKVSSEMQVFVHDRAIEQAIMKHPLMQKERKREEQDVTFLGRLPEAPWPQNVLAMLRDRARTQETLLGMRR